MQVARHEVVDPRLVVPDQAGKLIGRPRLAEQIVLHQIALVVLEKVPMVLSLNALGDHSQPIACAILIISRTISSSCSELPMPRVKL